MHSMSDDCEYECMEYTILQKGDVLAYKVPPRSPDGHRAESWKNCVWRGRLKVCAQGPTLTLKLIDVENEKLFAKCSYKPLLENKVERTIDSSRYFVLKLGDNLGRHALLGIGFENRNDAFDLNCALIDFERQLTDKKTTVSSDANYTPRDYKLKEGEKIVLNIKGMKSSNRPKKSAGDFPPAAPGVGLLPPPPSTDFRVSKVEPLNRADDFPFSLKDNFGVADNNKTTSNNSVSDGNDSTVEAFEKATAPPEHQEMQHVPLPDSPVEEEDDDLNEDEFIGEFQQANYCPPIRFPEEDFSAPTEKQDDKDVE